MPKDEIALDKIKSEIEALHKEVIKMPKKSKKIKSLQTHIYGNCPLCKEAGWHKFKKKIYCIDAPMTKHYVSIFKCCKCDEQWCMFIEKEEQDNKRCGDCKYFQSCVWSRGSLDKICEEFR